MTQRSSKQGEKLGSPVVQIETGVFIVRKNLPEKNDYFRSYEEFRSPSTEPGGSSPTEHSDW